MTHSLLTDSGRLIEASKESNAVFSGKLLNVFVDYIELPDGNSATRDWIKHPGACAIVPVFDDGTIMLLKQFRYPSRQLFFEVPAGRIDSKEDPKFTAIRELKEETGLECEMIEYAGHFYPAIGYSDEIIHIYAAYGLNQFLQNLVDDEFLVNHRIPYKTALQMIHEGIIGDGKTICALFKAKMWWDKEGPFPVDFI